MPNSSSSSAIRASRSDGSLGLQTAKIPSPHSIAAILSPSDPPSTIDTPEASTPKRPHAEAFPEADTEFSHRPAASPPSRRRLSDTTNDTNTNTNSTPAAGVHTHTHTHRPEPPGARHDAPRHVDMHDDPDDKKPLPKMRSSIACYRCRRSKIKCQNNGVNTACRACANQSRECTYPEPSASQQANKRPESTIAARVDGEGGDVKRVRKRESDAVRKQSFRQSDDPLESPPITAKLWKDVYTTFMLHCSTELPFLHEEVFHTRVHQPAAERSADTQIFLLGMLTLTARFIPDLVAYHSQSDPSDPLAASEFYAEAFAARLDAPALTGQPSLERVQGLLMISLYHWGMCRGQRAWMYITIAIGMARTMGLMFEEDSRTSQKPALIEEARQLGVKLKVAEAGAAPDEQTLIQREIKRRTAYSCFILDRYQASGRYRPQIINIDDLHVQLPCSEEDFQFGVDVKTGSLKDTPRSPDSRDGSRTISSTNVLSIYIRLVEIWGRFSRWSCRGGRREEQYPPWDQRSEFYKLRQQLVAFHESLPPKLTFSPTKIAAHIASKSITLYTAIHTLYSLCNIVLHREYIPFIPIRSVGPSGPLDEPTFPPDKYDIPEGFWDESAELIFKSARDIMDIVRVTSDRQVMVESPQVGFAVWTAAFVGIYAVHFPWMDKNSYMSNSPTTLDHNPTYPTGRHEATDLAVKTLNLMLPRSKMACGWSVWIKRMEHYFVNIKKDHNRSIRALGLPSSEHQRREAHAKELSLREGGHGGGLEEYKLLEKELKDFGPSLEQDRYDSPDRISPFSATNGGSRPSTHIKAEPQPSGHARSASRNGNDNGWVTVNTTAPPSNGSVAEEYTPSNKGYVNHHASPKNTATYYPQNSTYAAATTLNSMYPPPANGTTNSTPYDHPSQSSPETYKPGPPASTSSGNWASPKPSPESAFRRLEEISMHGGKDLEIFGTGMDMETDIWANGYVMDDGMGVNFMQAVVWGPQ
ncbi:hypothetical protein VE01_01370 [Pseudogymnoascus verrucosus]|uniref:Zn(2)-C6 fungal-type domain-containing protein n=1 Tax=Pseudogymnoascus verrucosus TaxID=342668 RepID=A0A1B8GXC6_9PEZI|nr:uncharacterized protein VE01_01370 [Pseudogymnoascus verrucosus]OBU00502.1 hypothetical protein VE01_01370 [Pseudogymnoascus verrucosus]